MNYEKQSIKKKAQMNLTGGKFMNAISLTKNELEIMELMWKEERPLSRTEIIELSPNRSWSASSIHILLNKLLEKKAIEVSGFVQTNKNYGRTYAPLITQNDYLLFSLNELKESPYYKSKSDATVSIFSALIEDKDVSDELLCELEEILEERKRQNKK